MNLSGRNDQQEETTQMPRYADYRFARELQGHGRAVDEAAATRFLRVLRDDAGILRAVLHARPGNDEGDDWTDAHTALTDEADALRTRASHGGSDEARERELLLTTAYARLNHDKGTARNVYVPDSLRPWAARFTVHHDEVLIYVQAASATGARWAATETIRLALDDETARFTEMQ